MEHRLWKRIFNRYTENAVSAMKGAGMETGGMLTSKIPKRKSVPATYRVGDIYLFVISG